MSEKYKPTTVFSAVSALACIDTLNDFVLPTQKWDGNPLFYRQLKNMKHELSLRYRNKNPEGGGTYNVKRSTPIGAQSVSFLLSYFQVYDEPSFLRLPRARRHHLVFAMMQHTCGMRFGHLSSCGAIITYRSSFTKYIHGTFRLIMD